MAKRLEVKTGDRYGRLTILKEVSPYVSPSGNKARRVLVQCDCGGEPFVTALSDLRRGHTASCGCVRKEKLKESNKENKKKYNTYDLSGEYGIGYTTKGEEFYFDLEDFYKIKDFCWRFNDKGYVVARDSNTKKLISMHRLLMNASEEMVIDHIFHHTNDNRKSQLREVTPSQNGMNRIVQKRNASGVTGVSWDKACNKWRAYIGINNNVIHLGDYTTKEDAIQARLKGEQLYFGEYSPNIK